MVTFKSMENHESTTEVKVRKSWNPIRISLCWAGGLAQVAEHLLSKGEALEVKPRVIKL
jgi:hypothetical protein